jgi:hypothetical protein
MTPILLLTRACATRLAWRDIAACCITATAVTVTTAAASAPQQRCMMLLAVTVLACIVAVAAHEPARQIAMVTPVSARTRIAIRAVVAAAVSGAALAIIATIAAVGGTSHTGSLTRLWACLSILALTCATMVTRRWPNIPPLAAASTALTTGIACWMMLPPITTQPWNSIPLQLGTTTTIAVLGLSLATRDPPDRHRHRLQTPRCRRGPAPFEFSPSDPAGLMKGGMPSFGDVTFDQSC